MKADPKVLKAIKRMKSIEGKLKIDRVFYRGIEITDNIKAYEVPESAIGIGEAYIKRDKNKIPIKVESLNLYRTHVDCKWIIPEELK